MACNQVSVAYSATVPQEHFGNPKGEQELHGELHISFCLGTPLEVFGNVISEGGTFGMYFFPVSLNFSFSPG